MGLLYTQGAKGKVATHGYLHYNLSPMKYATTLTHVLT